jgi:hypothetical protein
MGYSGARGTLIYEKNLKSKISCQTPFNETYMRRSGVWEELLLVDSRVQNVSVENEGLSLSFANICAKWNGECK